MISFRSLQSTYFDVNNNILKLNAQYKMDESHGNIRDMALFSQSFNQRNQIKTLINSGREVTLFICRLPFGGRCCFVG